MSCCRVNSCFFIPLWSREKFCFCHSVSMLLEQDQGLRCAHHSIHDFDETPERHFLIWGHDYIHWRTKVRHSLYITFVRNEFDIHFLDQLNTERTKLCLIEIIGKQNAPKPFDMLITWRLCANVTDVWWDGRVPPISLFLVVNWFSRSRRRSGEQRLIPIRTTTIDVDAVTFL